MSALYVKRMLRSVVALATVVFCGAGISVHAATVTVSGTALTNTGSASVCTYSAITESGNGNWAVTCGSGSRTISISPELSGSVCDSYTSVSQSGQGDWTVSGCSSAAPTIALDAPATSGQTYPTGTAFLLKATAAAPSGRTISSVQFFADGNLIHAGTLVGAQYEWSWNPPSGVYLVLARATDSAGAVSDTAPKQMTFQPAAPSMTIHYLHPDHLGTPRAITRASDNQVVWKWDNTEPFGNSAPNENPNGLGMFTYNARFPGQYLDVETGLHYNYSRDYDAKIGRYIQSDPIGLWGGISTYSYVDGDPLTLTDSLGLRREDEHGGRGGGFGSGPRPPPGFPGLSDHASRHGNGMSRGQYYQDALNNIERGRGFSVKQDGQPKICYVTRLGPDEFSYTVTAGNGRVILTHFPSGIDSAYIGRQGIQLPKGF